MDKRLQQLISATTLNSNDYLVIGPSGSLTALKATLSLTKSYMPERIVYLQGTTQASPYSASINDNIILCHYSSSETNIYLPNPTGNAGMKFIIKDWKGLAGDYKINILGSGWKYDTSLSSTITTNYGCRTFISDGNNYVEVSNFN